MAVVEIECAIAVAAGIDVEIEWSGRLFGRALNHWLARKDRTGVVRGLGAAWDPVEHQRHETEAALFWWSVQPLPPSSNTKMRTPQLRRLVAAPFFGNPLGLIIGCRVELSFFTNTAQHVDKKETVATHKSLSSAQALPVERHTGERR